MPDHPCCEGDLLRARVIAAARTCLGTPFRHQGRLPDRGLDCVGVIVVAARALGMAPADYRDYGRLPQGGLLEARLATAGLKAVDPAAAGPGDVLVFTFERWPRHVGLKTDRGLLHAWAQRRRVVEHSMTADWLARISGAFRFPGV
jgi:cell wall-associated NlpC family hydrolase